MNLIDLKMSGLTNKLADELHQRVIKSFPKRHVYVHSIDQTWAVDLVDMQQYSKQNKNYKYLLAVIKLQKIGSCNFFSISSHSKPFCN